MSDNENTPHSPFRSRPVRFSVGVMSPPFNNNNNNKRRASEPACSNKNSNTNAAHKKARHSMTATTTLSTKTLIAISPYENDYCAETEEPLFVQVANLFESLTDFKKYGDRGGKVPQEYQDKVKKDFSRLDCFHSKPTNEFLEKVFTAYRDLQKEDSIWDEGWAGALAFGGRSGKAIPDYLLLLLVPPNLIQNASNKDVVDFFSLRNTYNQDRNVLRLFKEAVAKLDVDVEYPVLHRTPGKATRTCATRKMALFVIRVYMAMTLCGYDKWEDINSIDAAQATSPNHGTLQQKVSECLQLLQTSASLSLAPKDKATASSNGAASAAVPKESCEEALSLKRESKDEEDEDDEETETKEDSFFETQVTETGSSSDHASVLQPPENNAHKTTVSSYQSAIDFLQAQQEQEAATQRQLEKLQKQTIQQSRLNAALSNTVKHCRNRIAVYKDKLVECESTNATLVQELANNKKQQSDERLAFKEEVEKLRQEKKKLLDDMQTIRDAVLRTNTE